jgi:hypothetical protein
MTNERLNYDPESWKDYYSMHSGPRHKRKEDVGVPGTTCYICPDLNKRKSAIHFGNSRNDSPFNVGQHIDLTFSGKRSYEAYFGPLGMEKVLQSPPQIRVNENGCFEAGRFVLPVQKLRFCSLSNYNSYGEVAQGARGTEIFQQTLEGLSDVATRIGEVGGYQNPQVIAFINNGWDMEREKENSVQAQPHAHGHVLIVDGNQDRISPENPEFLAERVVEFINQYAGTHEERLVVLEGNDWEQIAKFHETSQTTMLFLAKDLLRNGQEISNGRVAEVLQTDISGHVMIGASMVTGTGNIYEDASGYLREWVGTKITIPIINESFEIKTSNE